MFHAGGIVVPAQLKTFLEQIWLSCPPIPVHIQLFELELRCGLLPNFLLLKGVELGGLLEQVEVVPQALEELEVVDPAPTAAAQKARLS